LASDNYTVDNGNVTYPWIDRVFENEDPAVQQTITLFADFGRKTRIFAVTTKEWWTRHALGDSVADNAFAIALGYCVLAILLAIYLNVLTLGSMRNAGRAVRQTVHNQLLVLKVRMILSITNPESHM
jgi:E3 ubiquitin-protein ligase MARCH6